MEASALQATATLARQRPRVSGGSLLRLCSDEQLVRLFRAGNEDAFRAIHDRYQPRLFAYARQMLAGSRQDAEDALQDVFVRAYGALRANDRDISLRAWLYRVAHNRCIDELRRPAPPAPETLEAIQPRACDPIAEAEQRESLRRLVEDVRRLPEQQRSALLMREIVGMSYNELAAALDVTVPAVKSLLVRARVGLAQAAEARDADCVEIRAELTDAHDRGVRATGRARRHLHDCSGCRAYRHELKALRDRFAALTPAVGLAALAAKLLGIGAGAKLLGIGSGATGTSAAASSGAAASGAGAAASGAAASGAAATGCGAAITGGSIGASHVAAVVAVAVVGAGGAVEVQQTLTASSARHAHHRHTASVAGSPQRTASAAMAATAIGLAPAGGGFADGASPAAHRRRPAGTAATTRLRAVTVVRPPVTVGTTPQSGPQQDNATGGAAAPPDPTLTATDGATTMPITDVQGQAGAGGDTATTPAGLAPGGSTGSGTGTGSNGATGGSGGTGTQPPNGIQQPAGQTTGTSASGVIVSPAPGGAEPVRANTAPPPPPGASSGTAPVR